MSAQSSVNEVRVTAAARLHLGFLDMNGGLGRKFGGLGLSIGGPRTRLTLKRADETLVEGAESERARRLLRKAQAALSPAFGSSSDHSRSDPRACGTWFGHSIGAGHRRGAAATGGFAARPNADAALMERGARSGLGAGLFQDGGFVVDGGRGAAASPRR